MNIKDRVFVLSSVPYRDSDLIVNFLSEKSGKLTAVLYGGKKINKSSTFFYQPGDLIELEYEKSEAKDFIKVLNSNGYSLLRLDRFPYQRFLFHAYLLEVSSKISRPELSSSEIYKILLENNRLGWSSLNKVAFITWAIWNLIQAGGYQIDFSQCSQCQKETWRTNEVGDITFRKQFYTLDNRSGNLVCQECLSKPETTSLMNSAMVKVLWLYCQHVAFSETLRLLPVNTLLPLAKLLNTYLLTCYEINPRSLSQFLQMMDTINT